MKLLPLLQLLLLLLSSAALGQYNVRRQDPFALLSATLRTYQKAACDNQELGLECPSGTKISIQLVEYGRSAPSNQVRFFLFLLNSRVRIERGGNNQFSHSIRSANNCCCQCLQS